MQESQSRTIPEEIVLRAEQMNAGIEDKMSNAKRNQSIQAIKTSNVYKNTCKQSNSYWPYKPVVLLLMAAVHVQCSVSRSPTVEMATDRSKPAPARTIW